MIRSLSLRPCCFAAFLLALVGCGEANPPGPLPNLVLVLSDSLRAANLPLYGYHRDTAPNLSRLASESIVFQHHLANYPATPFSVSQMFSGRLMSPLLMSFTPTRVPVRELSEDLLILPRELQGLGYRTGIVTAHPWFDERARILPYFESSVVKLQPSGAYASFADLLPEIDRFLDTARTDARPFFLYVHAMDTHTPMSFHPGHDAWRQAPDRLKELNAYDSEIHYTDHHVGLLLARLARSGLLDKTIFVFTSDHGEEFGEAGPFWWDRGHGATLRRPLLHIPLLLRMPRGAHARRYSRLSRHIDLAPTLLGLLDAGFVLDDFRVDGSDLSGELRQPDVPGGSERRSFSYNWPFWASHDRKSELHHNLWSNTFTLFNIEADASNYPQTEAAVDAPELGERTRELTRRMQAARLDFQELPPDPGALADALIGLPTHVDREEGSVPTYSFSARDDRWHLSATLLEARSSEHPGALVLDMPWVAGRYEVFVRFSPRRVKAGYANRFRIQFLGGGNPAVNVDGRDIDEHSLFPLGEQKIPNLLRIRVSEPEGDVGIAGFQLRRVGSDAPRRPTLDPARERQLRSLGYLE